MLSIKEGKISHSAKNRVLKRNQVTIDGSNSTKLGELNAEISKAMRRYIRKSEYPYRSRELKKQQTKKRGYCENTFPKAKLGDKKVNLFPRYI